MHKFWLIARREYLKCWKMKGFLVLTLGLPAAIFVGLAVAIVMSDGGPTTVGYVDRAGVIQDTAAVSTVNVESLGQNRDKVRFQAFSDAARGRAAVTRREIEALFVLPADYLASGRVEAYYWDRPPSDTVLEQSELLLRANLVGGHTPEIVARVLQGPHDLTLRSLDGLTRSGGYGFGAVVVPAALALFFTFSLMTSATYLLRAVSEEKENRTVEVMVTSVSVNQLIGGKAAGLIAAALTQMVVWGTAAVVGLMVAARSFPLPGGLEFSGSFAAVAVLYFVPSFVMAAGLVILTGATVGDFQQGEQISGVLSILFMLPIFFVALLFENPDSPVLVFLTLFPTSSFATVAFRWGATMIPFWQLAASWAVLVGAAGAVVILAPRIFRRGMLRYGKSMSVRGLLDAARSKGA